MTNEIAAKFVPAVSSVIKTLLTSKNARVATKFISDKLIVRATRRVYKGKNGSITPNQGNVEIVLTIGRPNYQEVDKISAHKKTKKPFPIPGTVIKLVVSKKK